MANSKYDHLWNDLPIEERKRLMPTLIEGQILHLEQGKLKVIRAHVSCIQEFNSHIKNLKADLTRLEMKGLKP